MTMEALRTFVVSAMTLIGQREHLPTNDALVDATTFALLADGEDYLTGSLEGDAVLMIQEAYEESRWGWGWDGRALAMNTCPNGDHGKAWGYWQLQTRAEIGCDPNLAARQWLAWAHASQRRCARLPFEEQLAELHSGTCALGHVVSRGRFRRAATTLVLLGDSS
jgi:hypothetical protein